MFSKKKTADDILKKWEKQKPILEAEEKVRQEKIQIVEQKAKLSMTKKIVLFLVLNCTIIELFTAHLMIEQMEMSKATGIAPDMSPQMALITAIISEVIAFLIYAYKSLQENKRGGITYDLAMQKQLAEEDDSLIANG